MIGLFARAFRPAVMRGVRQAHVTQDASVFFRDLRKDGILFLTLVAFGSIATVVGYSILDTKRSQPRDIVGLPKLKTTGYEGVGGKA